MNMVVGGVGSDGGMGSSSGGKRENMFSLYSHMNITFTRHAGTLERYAAKRNATLVLKKSSSRRA